MHDVDVVIEIPELGRAVQFGRFNQGGEMQIFEEENESPSPTLPEGKGEKEVLPFGEDLGGAHL